MRLDREDFLTVVRLTPLVSIDLIARAPDGSVLVGLRANAPARDTWFVPGGRVCKDERLDEAFRRIAREELGVELERASATFVGVYEHLYPDNVAGEPGYGTHYVVLAHEVALDPARLSAPDAQHRRWRWLATAELRADPAVHAHVRAYFAR